MSNHTCCEKCHPTEVVSDLGTLESHFKTCYYVVSCPSLKLKESISLGWFKAALWESGTMSKKLPSDRVSLALLEIYWSCNLLGKVTKQPITSDQSHKTASSQCCTACQSINQNLKGWHHGSKRFMCFLVMKQDRIHTIVTKDVIAPAGNTQGKWSPNTG